MSIAVLTNMWMINRNYCSVFFLIIGRTRFLIRFYNGIGRDSWIKCSDPDWWAESSFFQWINERGSINETSRPYAETDHKSKSYHIDRRVCTGVVYIFTHKTWMAMIMCDGLRYMYNVTYQHEAKRWKRMRQVNITRA